MIKLFISILFIGLSLSVFAMYLAFMYNLLFQLAGF